jgi:hypothetical protein
MDFGSTYIFMVKIADNITNLASGRIINPRTHHNSLCRDKNKHWVTRMVYKEMSHVVLYRMRELSPIPSLIT